MSDSTFPQRVAAGDVGPEGATLWSRSTVPGEVAFEVARDPGFADVVAGATATVDDTDVPAKVAIEGLEGGETYHYRAVAANGDADRGTFATPFEDGQHGFRLGVSGDWRGELSPYPAITNAADADLDAFVLHGDTIYADYPSPAVPKEQAETLDEFYAKHAEVYGERFGLNAWGDLRAATATFATIDDHEVTNDFAGGAPPSFDPRFAAEDVDFINDTGLYDNGLAAFEGYNPLTPRRYGETGDPRTAGEIELYRTQAYGKDAQIFVTDARSFRDPGLAPADTSDPNDVGRFLAESFAPERTFLGEAQLEQLKADLLKADQDGVTWKLVMAPEPVQNLGVAAASDRYEGYAAERSELLGFIDQNDIDNVVFVAADIHGTIVNNLTYQTGPGGPQIATDAFEVTTGSVAFDPPFGPAVVGLSEGLGLLTPEQRDLYASLPAAPDADGLPNDKDDFLAGLIDAQTAPFGYDPLGLDNNLAKAEGLIDATLLQGGYTAAHTYGWTEFDVDRETQALTVTTYGIEPYSEEEIADDPDAILAREPAIVGQFEVKPQLENDMNEEFGPIGRYAAGGDEPVEGAAEIVAFDPESARLFVTNGADNTLDVLDLGDPGNPTKINAVDLAPYGDGPTSVSVKDGVVAVALPNPDGNDEGSLVFFDADGNLTGTAEAGVLPDAVTIANGPYPFAITANEGQPTDEGNPEGSVSLIDYTNDAFVKPELELDFARFDGREQALNNRGVRVFPDESASKDFEPEYAAVDPFGRLALVTLQENNALARVDLKFEKIDWVRSLGTKDHGLPGSGLDASDEDGGINVQNWPVKGLYQPDGIAGFADGREPYWVIANEGDARDEDVRVEDLALDPTAFPNAAELQKPENLGRLEVSSIDGDTDGDGGYDELYGYGARSISVVDKKGNVVWDSGDALEQLTAELTPDLFNSDGDAGSFDQRSDNKGPEPEGVVTFEQDGTWYVAAGLERNGSIVVYDLSDPTSPEFKGLFRGEDGSGLADVAPEGLTFIDAKDGPTGEGLLAVAYEVSGTVSVFEKMDVDDDGGTGGGTGGGDGTPFTLELLFASDLEGDVGAIGNAPNFAAIAEYFQDTGDEATLTLSAGDNYLPGPFFAAANDEGVAAALAEVYRDLYGAEVGETVTGSGFVDLTIMNVVGFDASAVGNHEFDLGEGAFGDIIGAQVDEAGLLAYPGAQFPYLSANLDFEASELAGLFTPEAQDSGAYVTDPENPDAETPKLAPSTIVEVDGEKIGVVGATTPLLASISSPGTVGVEEPGAGTNDIEALARILQPEIDALEAQGIDKIVTVTHLQQFALENELAGLLDGVDIMVAGGSDTLLADGDDELRPGDAAAAALPVFQTDAAGDPVAIVSTDGQYSYLGRLTVEFDAEGRVIPESVDPATTGAYATTDATVEDLYGDQESAFAEGTAGSLVHSLTDAVSDVVVDLDGNVFGATEVFLDGRREEVRTQETNLGDLSADANLAYARDQGFDVDVSLKNGGGIRNPIGTLDADGTLLPPQANPLSGKEEGEISQLDIQDSLRFNNGLSVLTLSAEDLKAVVEHGVAASVPGDTPGQFPQIGGMAFSFDPDAEAGSRVQSLAILNDDGGVEDVIVEGAAIQGDAERPIDMVTLGFLADGGDGYPFPDLGENVIDLALDEAAPRTGDAAFAPDGTEQDALAEHLLDAAPFAMAETPPEEDERIQIIGLREDTVLEGVDAMMG